MSFVSAVKIWIWLSVIATLAGWTLSCFGALHAIGYLVFGAVSLMVFLLLRSRPEFQTKTHRWRWLKIRQRLARPIPLLFAILALLVLLGGLLYPPTNHTGLSYRVPRVLHWLAAAQWHWIDAPNIRMNTRACGIEWLSAPLFLFGKSDRGLFLLNFIPYLLMPGLLFSVLTRLGIRGRVAWSWMWLLPTGYVFVLQAGSAGNDAFPVVYALAAVDFACRAWVSRRVGDVWLSLLAVALLTGAKASNLPLCLMWFVLVIPLWHLLKSHLIGTGVAVVLALVVSFLPTALLNIHYCGNWSGLNLEHAGMAMSNPLVGVWGNALLLTVNNLCPPLFPMAGWWNQHSVGLLPDFLAQPLLTNFENNFQLLWELPHEDWSGIGPGVTVLLLISACWGGAHFFRGRPATASESAILPLVLTLARLAPWIALLAYCAKSGMVTPARLIAPYYPLLLPALLVGGGQSALVRKRWWRALGVLVYLITFAVLIVTPARPLWPAKTILHNALARHPESRLLSRALTTYTTYATRSDPEARLRAALPADLKIVGFLGTVDDLDISFWRPFGTRRVIHIFLPETAAEIRQRNIQFAVVSHLHLELEHESFAGWLERTRAEEVTNIIATVSVQTGPQRWSLVRFKD